MADAWGRITGQLGVAMYTTPGFANAIPGSGQRHAQRKPTAFHRRFRRSFGVGTGRDAGD